MQTSRRLNRGRGLRTLVRPLAFEVYALLLDSLSALRRHRLPDPPLRLHLGGGPDVRTGWVNIDLDRRADLHYDLRERVPLPDSCASVIAAEHTFEHFAYPRDTAPFLAECRRLLAPGGLLALSVPDAAEGIHRYASDDREWFEWARKRWRPPDQHAFTPMAQINYGFRQDGQHHYAYDAETLIAVIKAAGFVEVHVREFDPVLDTEMRREITLRVSASRP